MALYDLKNSNNNSILPIESGSNSNGNWVKFADGTMIQYGILPLVAKQLTTTILPINFTNSQYSIVSNYNNSTEDVKSNVPPCTFSNKTSSSFKAYSEGGQYAFIAIGRWK